MNYAGIYMGPEAPPFLQELLSSVGGKNIWGTPIFRLVHAGFRLEPAGGTWIEWPEGLNVNLRREDKATPIRRVAEVRMTLKYPDVKKSQDGEHWWVLEKWHGPETYGSPERWYLPSSSGGTLVFIEKDFKHLASQGEFPFEGAYEHTNFEFPQLALTERVVLSAMQRIIAKREEGPSTPYGRMLRRVFQAQEAEKAMATRRRAADYDLLNECDTAFGNQPTSFGGSKKGRRSVNTFVERAGIRSHSGVS